jgi:hypothetical protein
MPKAKSKPKPKLKTFAPEHLVESAKESGFLQCPKCGLVWFGKPDSATCPQAPHGRPVHVAVICRSCDIFVPIERMAAHLADAIHNLPM